MQIKDLISYSSGGILSKEIMRNDKQNITLFCMAAGTQLTEHTASKEAVVYVLEGKGTFVLEGKHREMVSGVFIQMKKKQPHALQAQENTSFLLFLW